MLNTVRVPEKLVPLFEQAQKYVARYFDEQRSHPERAYLEISGQRYVLVRAASMSVEFYELVRSLYGRDDEAHAVTHGLLFDVAHAMGMADSKAFAERMNVTEPIARLSAGPIHFAHAGWAFVDISEESSPSPNNDYYLLYDHPYSFESDSWLTAGRLTDCPVCVMNSGYSSGWCEHAFGFPLVAVEILCRAKGDEACRFIMAPPDRIEGHVSSYVERHPELRERIRNYQIPGFFAKRTDEQLLRTNLELERRAEQRLQELANINQQLQHDISERKRAELALLASKELNERLIEALPGGVVHVNTDGSFLNANAEGLRILGLSYDALSKRLVQDFEAETIHEDGSRAKATDYPVVKALRTGQTQPALTLGVKRPDGTVSWAVYRAVATRHPVTQEITGAVVTLFDITERKRVEDKLRHTQKLESLGVLAGGIAHDFNNLLVAILGNASFAKSLPTSTPELTQLLEEIEIGARRAAELTRQMLDYSGKGQQRVVSVDLPATIKDIAKLLSSLLPKQVQLHCQVQEGLPRIDADASQLRQMLMNLILNAAEAIGQRSGRVLVSVELCPVSQAELDEYETNAASAGSFLYLRVKDDGCGMDEQTRSRVFDPFFTTKLQGRGLGMATVLGIVRGHGGAIRVTSESGLGTEVRVLLPAKAQQRAGEPGPKGTILVVDDDDAVRSIVSRALKAHGYGVLTATNGLDAIAVFVRNAADVRLILMDMTMPQMNGTEALRGIRQTGSQVPVLLCSGYGASAAAASGEFNGFLEKPYDIRELLVTIEQVIGGNAPYGVPAAH
jgi:PAS domain S-box-containing protein